MILQIPDIRFLYTVSIVSLDLCDICSEQSRYTLLHTAAGRPALAILRCHAHTSCMISERVQYLPICAAEVEMPVADHQSVSRLQHYSAEWGYESTTIPSHRWHCVTGLGPVLHSAAGAVRSQRC